jgi:very-short-patch-repair endonuclease
MEETRAQQRRRKTIYAQKIRKHMTNAEEILWEALRNRQCADMKFRRQVPMFWFVADFLCFQYKLIIEVDGSIHETQKEYDQERELELKERGYKMLRFTNDEVIHRLNDCIQKIIQTR